MKPIWKLLLIVFWLVIDHPKPLTAAVFDRQGNKLSEVGLDPERVDWQLLESRPNVGYSGIGLITIREFSNCTGFLIATHHQAPAYVVTNGHCIDLIDNLLSPTEIVVDRRLRQSGRSAAVLSYTPDYFVKPQRSRRTYKVQRILYATMKNSDLALLELPITQGDLIRTGISPLTIAPQPAPLGQRIEVVGVPGSVIPNHRHFLHRSSCLLGPTVRVKEGVYEWTQALRNRCSVVGGMSGSPMIANGQVVGIINTGGGYDRDRNLCALNNPCEVGSNGRPQHTIHENYGQPIDQLPSCFNERGLFDLARSSCRLEKPRR